LYKEKEAGFLNDHPDIKFLLRLFTEIRSSFSKNVKTRLQEHHFKKSNKIHKEFSSTRATIYNYQACGY
jgi:hypothetical protein